MVRFSGLIGCNGLGREPGGGEYLHNLFCHGTGGDDSIEGADAAGGEYDSRTPVGDDIGVDVSEVEPVDVDLKIGAACAKDVKAEAVPVFLFHEGSLEGAHGEKRGFRMDADGASGLDGLRALDGTRLGSVGRRSRLSGLCQSQRGEAEGESGLDHETIHRISFLNDKSDVREIEGR